MFVVEGLGGAEKQCKFCFEDSTRKTTVQLHENRQELRTNNFLYLINVAEAGPRDRVLFAGFVKQNFAELVLNCQRLTNSTLLLI